MQTWKDILKNFISLTSAELLSKLIAFFTTVYLARTITPEGFGIIGFATAFVSYFILFIDLGLDTISIKKIANDKSIIANYVNSILSFRILLSIVIYVVLVIVVLIINITAIQKAAILLLGLNLFVQSITLDFVFQATEKIKYLSIKVISKNLLTLALVFIFIKSISDVLLVILFYVITNLIVSVWMLKKYSRLFEKFKWNINNTFMKKLVAESFPLAISAFMISIYYNIDLVMIGAIKTETEVGIYNAVYRIFMIGIVPLTVIGRIFLPSLSRVNKSKVLNNILLKYSVLILSSGILIASITYFNSFLIVKLIYGNLYLSGEIALKILAMNLLVVSVNHFFGYPLPVWGKQKLFAVILTFGAISNILLNLFFIPKYSYFGAAFTSLISEVIVFIGVIFIFNSFLTENKNND